MGYFLKEVAPDIVNGDVSNVIQSNKTDKPFGGSDILFDWTSFEIPSGGARLESVVVHVMGEDGGTAAEQDLVLYFARTVNGNAPDSLGTVNNAMTTGFNFPTALVAGVKLEGAESASQIIGPAFGDVLINSPYSAHGLDTRQVFQAEDSVQTGRAGFDTFYVCGFAGGAYDFSTGVLLNDASDVADDAGTSLTVDGVDPRKCFQIGDTVYIHDVDVPIGTVASMTANTIVLAANNVGGITDDDEFINANPIRIKLGFSN